MFKHTLINIRDNPEINWYALPAEVVSRRQNYETEMKIISRTEEESPDLLLRTIVTQFVSYEAYIEYTTDPIITSMFDERNEYNMTNNIITVMETE